MVLLVESFEGTNLLPGDEDFDEPDEQELVSGGSDDDLEGLVEEDVGESGFVHDQSFFFVCRHKGRP